MTSKSPINAAEDLEILDRRGLLRVLTQAINDTADRLAGDRFRPRDGDREKLQYLRALAALVAAYNGVIASTHDQRLEWPAGRRQMSDEGRRRSGRDPDLEDLIGGFGY